MSQDAGKPKRSAILVATSFPRRFPDQYAQFVWDFAKNLAPEFRDFFIYVPHSSNDEEPSLEVHGNISIRRFTYFFKNRWQRLVYGHGAPSNLKYSWLSRVQVPFFLLTLLGGVLRHGRKADVIFCHWLPTIFAGLPLKWLCGTKLVVILHGSDIRDLPRFVVRWLLNRVDIVVAGHEELMEKVAESEVSTPCLQIRNFIEMNKFKTSERLRRKRILFPSRLYPMKDPLFFLKVSEVLERKHPDIECVLLGDGELRGEVERFIKEKCLKNLQYLGMRNDVVEQMMESQLVFFSDTLENLWGMVILEAIFSRTVCIMNKVGRAERVFQDGVNAVLYEHQSVEDCVRKIERFFSDGYDARLITENALRLMDEQGFSTKSILQKHREYLRGLF